MSPNRNKKKSIHSFFNQFTEKNVYDFIASENIFSRKRKKPIFHGNVEKWPAQRNDKEKKNQIENVHN